MTGIKFCGLSRPCDIEAANELKPEYVGFVFFPGSRRYVEPRRAAGLRRLLLPEIRTVGVFVNEPFGAIAALAEAGVIDMIQLHGNEDKACIRRLQLFTGKPVIQAFPVKTEADLSAAVKSPADYILLDSGAGTGTVFDWNLVRNMERPYFLAGGLEAGNVTDAVRRLKPFAVDVSSGIETDGKKDKQKMAAFAAAVRKEEKI